MRILIMACVLSGIVLITYGLQTVDKTQFTPIVIKEQQKEVYILDEISICKCYSHPDGIMLVNDFKDTTKKYSFEFVLAWDKASTTRYENSCKPDKKIGQGIYFDWDQFKKGDLIYKKDSLLIHKNYIFKIYKS